MKQQKKAYLKYFGMLIIAILVIVGALYHLTSNRAPQDIGKFKYIGEESLGCYFACNVAPTHAYYFATSMDESKLIIYLSEKAALTKMGEPEYNFGYSKKDIYFKNRDGRPFYITVFDSEGSLPVRARLKLKQSSLPNTISVHETGIATGEKENLSTFEDVVDDLRK